MFNSNSHKDLLDCIDKYSKDSEESKNTVTYVRDVCIKNSLNYDKSVEEIIKAVENTGEIKNIHGFVKAIANRIDPNKFGNGNVAYIPVIQPFINDLRDKKVVVLADDTVWLGEVWKYIINNLPIDVNECMALNHKIIAYMIGHNERTFEEYKSLLKKSKTLRPFEINWEMLEKTVEFEINKWNATLDELEAEE